MAYNKELKHLDEGDFIELECGYCGSTVISYRRRDSICQFCEAYVNEESPQGSNKEMISRLSSIQALIEEGKIKEATVSVDLLAGKSMDPHLLYGAANFYKFFSDQAYNDLDYNRKGFMEENSRNIYSSMDMISKSKEMFYKTIKISTDQTKNGPDPTLFYLAFISNIKLDRLVDAGKFLALLKQSSKDITLQYATMVYNVESNNRNAYTSLYSLLVKNNINAYYYLAVYYLKKKKMSDARVILQKLLTKTNMPMAVYLMRRIDRLFEETRL